MLLCRYPLLRRIRCFMYQYRSTCLCYSHCCCLYRVPAAICLLQHFALLSPSAALPYGTYTHDAAHMHLHTSFTHGAIHVPHFTLPLSSTTASCTVILTATRISSFLMPRVCRFRDFTHTYAQFPRTPGTHTHLPVPAFYHLHTCTLPPHAPLHTQHTHIVYRTHTPHRFAHTFYYRILLLRTLPTAVPTAHHYCHTRYHRAFTTGAHATCCLRAYRLHTPFTTRTALHLPLRHIRFVAPHFPATTALPLPHCWNLPLPHVCFPAARVTTRCPPHCIFVLPAPTAPHYHRAHFCAVG